ncbi:MAG: hypothetical protein WAW81_03400, partial [Minisyncoccia bacterium]
TVLLVMSVVWCAVLIFGVIRTWKDSSFNSREVTYGRLSQALALSVIGAVFSVAHRTWLAAGIWALSAILIIVAVQLAERRRLRQLSHFK